MSSTLTSIASATQSAADSDSTVPSDDGPSCGGASNSDTHFHLRIVSIFVILICSSFGAFFPVVARRSRLSNVIPKSVFDFAKYFGSGVIIATAFIHLLDPALDALGSPCLGGNWQVYPWALALAMLSIFCLFFAELIAFRWGTAKLKALGVSYDAHGHGTESGHAAHGPEGDVARQQATGITEDGRSRSSIRSDVEKNRNDSGGDVMEADPLEESAISHIIGIFILEFGIVLHSVLIGLTLAVDEDFTTLFVVLVFHQMFEGLGLGSRLAYLGLPARYNYVAYVAAMLYGLTTPVGIAAGLGVRSTYNPDSATASAVSGIMDSLSAGVLIYTGLVELLAHEFLFSPEMREASNKRLTFACVSMIAGAGIMALLGRWA